MDFFDVVAVKPGKDREQRCSPSRQHTQFIEIVVQVSGVAEHPEGTGDEPAKPVRPAVYA
jgi:hypothetical protein